MSFGQTALGKSLGTRPTYQKKLWIINIDYGTRNMLVLLNLIKIRKNKSELRKTVSSIEFNVKDIVLHESHSGLFRHRLCCPDGL